MWHYSLCVRSRATLENSEVLVPFTCQEMKIWTSKLLLHLQQMDTERNANCQSVSLKSSCTKLYVLLCEGEGKSYFFLMDYGEQIQSFKYNRVFCFLSLFIECPLIQNYQVSCWFTRSGSCGLPFFKKLNYIRCIYFMLKLGLKANFKASWYYQLIR